MREDAWFKMLVLSAAFHVLIIGAFSIAIPKGHKKLDISSAFSVGLTGDIGGAGRSVRSASAPAAKPLPGKQPAVKTAVTKPVPSRPKPVPVRKEKDAVSLSKKKVSPKEKEPVKEAPSKEELNRLESKIREMKRRTDYLDVTRMAVNVNAPNLGQGRAGAPSGLPAPGQGGGGPVDPAMQKYWIEVLEKVHAAWGVPSPSFKKLETIVTIRIRKDGRIVDISVDQRSGNRIYDESILRALRAVDPLPPIPSTLGTDPIDISFRFYPGES
jgi:colicin import membrane protein